MTEKKRQSKARIVNNSVPKAAGSGTGSGGGSGNGGPKVGAIYSCEVISKQKTGYEVYLLELEQYGFLPTENSYLIGIEIRVQFLCIHEDRLLLAELFPEDACDSKQ